MRFASCSLGRLLPFIGPDRGVSPEARLALNRIFDRGFAMSRKRLTPYQEGEGKAFIEALLPHLPPAISREAVEYFLGGMVAPKTLSNADSLGKGPAVAWLVGGKTVYATRALLEWVVSRWPVVRRRDDAFCLLTAQQTPFSDESRIPPVVPAARRSSRNA